MFCNIRTNHFPQGVAQLRECQKTACGLRLSVCLVSDRIGRPWRRYSVLKGEKKQKTNIYFKKLYLYLTFSWVQEWMNI